MEREIERERQTDRQTESAPQVPGSKAGGGMVHFLPRFLLDTTITAT